MLIYYWKTLKNRQNYNRTCFNQKYFLRENKLLRYPLRFVRGFQLAMTTLKGI